MIYNANEVKEFISKHHNPRIRVIQTIKDGYVSCIGPVRTICGPELHVSGQTRLELEKLIRSHA